MTSPFLTAMQEALAKITSAETRAERQEAEEHMAQLIRASFKQERVQHDVKAAQAGRDE